MMLVSFYRFTEQPRAGNLRTFAGWRRKLFLVNDKPISTQLSGNNNCLTLSMIYTTIFGG